MEENYTIISYPKIRKKSKGKTQPTNRLSITNNSKIGRHKTKRSKETQEGLNVYRNGSKTLKTVLPEEWDT